MAMKPNRTHWLTLILALLAHVPAQAAPSGSLAAALEQAWQRHPEAAALDTRDAAAQAAREQAAALSPEAPKLSLGSLNDRQGRNLGRQEWEVELAMPLWLPGQRAARGAEADRLIEEALARRHALRLELAGEVRETWWSLAAARAAQALAQRRLDAAQALAADVERRFRAGELSRIDANLAKGEVLAAQSEQVEAVAALEQAERGMQILAGMPAPVRLEAETPAASTATDAASHPRLAAAAAAAASAQARVRVADETRRAAPELALRLVRERGDFAEPYGNQLGVKLTIPFSSGPQVRRERAAADTEAAQADAELRRARARWQLDIERARGELAAAERQQAMAQERRALADDNLRLTEKSFALGEADLATLLRIRTAAREAESFHERQRLARAAAISRLNQTLGVLP
jgi:outer membrane protein TolC